VVVLGFVKEPTTLKTQTMDHEDRSVPDVDRNLTLVLLPGLDGGTKLFEPLLDCLPETMSRKMISLPQDVPLTYDQVAEYVCERLPKHSPYVLLGHSYGAPLAIKVASRRPPGLFGVIQAVGFVRCPHPWIPRVAGPLIDPLVRLAWPVLALLSRLFHWKTRKGIFSAIALVLETVSPSVVSQRLRSILTCDMRRELLKVNVPMLWMTGKRDILVPDWNWEAVRSALAERRDGRRSPECTRKRFDSRHLLLRGEPARAAAAIVGAFSRWSEQAKASGEKRHAEQMTC
jgi:pimeloyl-[acyl-carrier protein] methyl ester esterase